MFYKYEVVHNNQEELLYLYLNMKYEFANEFSWDNQKDLTRRTKNFIVSNNIPFHGTKVYLIIDDKVVKSLNIQDIEEVTPISDEYSLDQYMISIKLDDQAICEISLREYLLSILFSMYQENILDEVYKAIGVLFNTYAYRCMKKDGYIVGDNSFARYQPISHYRDLIPSFEKVYTYFNNILNDINCVFLSYHDEYILPFIHYSNSGKTLSNSMYPYLSSVKSLWDMASPYYIDIEDISFKEIYQRLGISLKEDSNITMVNRNNQKEIVLDQAIYTMEEFKNTFHLKSTDLFIIIHSDHLRIITRGWGNSYGLSIFGACEIAKGGAKYYQILKYYFPKVKLSKYIKELS